MTDLNTFRAVVAGTGAYLPEKILTNKDLEKSLDTSDAWITKRTGIRERRIAAEGESTSTMAAKAGKQALVDSGIGPREVDMIIVATSSPD
ncbi:MAG: 3-oxoacyl-ACP synthase, partial [Nitrospinaceae bacterium]|nr:3-oxoacyl-ACP synthase [Nitrospinaceae bacterium]